MVARRRSETAARPPTMLGRGLAVGDELVQQTVHGTDEVVPCLEDPMVAIQAGAQVKNNWIAGSNLE
ncbi:hypothetical protein GUJ93_ZPchr0013g36284 [Zizania palustris]|uniref:Uncharacterized protein n=1 Tax=Zizania palustris TaxID=103762 RepID=A0A8J5X341_ZIZPA|nr:hypothetical protein GUJ93_ZPchr0013g36284 [Zizania palustris]